MRIVTQQQTRQQTTRRNHMHLRNAALALIFSALALTAKAETSSYIVPIGGWPLCQAGVPGPWCAGAVTGTYALFVKTDNPRAVGWRYTITGHLKDGTTVTRTGMIERAENPSAVTIAPVAFGQAVLSSEIEMEDLVLDNGKVYARYR